MSKKASIAIALAVLAAVAVPATAANADHGYVHEGDIIVSGTPAPNAPVQVDFTEGSFEEEDVRFDVTGEGDYTLAVFKAAVVEKSIVKTASSAGAVTLVINLPADASGSYDVVATGLESGIVGVASVSVTPADVTPAGTGSGTAGGLASTGYDAPMLMIWAAGGALLLGIALVVVLGIVRRQRANA